MERLEQEAMMNWMNSRIVLLVGVAMLLIPTYVTTTWIVVFNLFDSHAERVAAFDSIVPSMLHHPFVALLFAFGGVAVGAVGLVWQRRLSRFLCALIIVFACLLSMLLVWMQL